VLIKLLESSIEGYPLFLKIAIFALMMSLFIGAFYGINKFMKDRHRVGIIALALSIASPGSGFAYSAAYIRAWLTVILLLITAYLGTIEEGDFLNIAMPLF